MSEKTKRPQIVQDVFTLKHKEYITPHYMRVTLTAKDISKFSEATVGVNNKIFIPPTGVDQVFFPDYNFETNTWTFPPENVRPTVRTYTHRGINLKEQEMVIDFVLHGDRGPASAWALFSKIGDPLGIAMKADATELYPSADWYLLVADGTGIPVLAAILETLPATAKGVAYIEVQSEADRQKLFTRSQVKIHWIYNRHPGEGNFLTDAVRSTSLPGKEDGSRFGYVAAEFSTVKNVRHFLRKEQDWTQEELYAYSYWKFGTSEDGSVNDRHQEHHEKS